MKSSKVIEKINNRILIIFPLLLLTSFVSFMFVLCNIAYYIAAINLQNYLIQLIEGNIMPIYIALSIPLFVLLLVYFNKLISLKEKIEERSWQMSTSFCVILDFIIKK